MEGETADVLDRPADYLDDPDPAVRRLAVATHAAGEAALPVDRYATILAADADPWVRAAAAEALGAAGAGEPLLGASADPDPTVVEAVAFALGEVGDAAAVPWLMETAADHADKLVREAAVAALGAIGDERALPLLLDLVAGAPPQVRRRAVVALTAFDGDEVEAAIRSAAGDRNPMVREAAEMVVGAQVDPGDLLRRC